MHQSKNLIVLGICAIAACGGKVEDTDAPDPTIAAHENAAPMGPHGRPEATDPPALGLHYARGEAGKPTGSTPGDMTWHSGAIMNDTVIRPIFWGPKWTDATWPGDKIAGLDSFYAGLGGTAYANSNSEYTGTNGQVGIAVSYSGYVVDPTPTGIKGSPRTSVILAEVCKQITSPVANGYYPVYTDVPRGSAGYCAWHSYGTCNNVPIQFGFFFALDGDPGCDPQDTQTTHSQGLAALANVSGHEYSEMITDPRNGGWYDSTGNENSDKCAWSWPAGAPTLITFANSTQWKIQANWSNAAFDAKTGFLNRDGQAGCLYERPLL